MAFSQIRDYLNEFRKTKLLEWKLFQKYNTVTVNPDSPHPEIDLRRLQTGFRNPTIADDTLQYHTHHKDTYVGFKESDHMKGEPYEYYMDIDPSTIPENRRPNPGITQLPLRYHPSQVVTPSRDVPETGFQLHPLLKYLIMTKYPSYMKYIHQYCRPLGTTDATFEDFNREQKEYPSIPTDLVDRIIKFIIKFIGAKKYLPVHYVDTFFTKMPLTTGTSYFYRHSYELRTHAAFSHSMEYANKITSKGYMLNSFTEWARTTVHHIKESSYPFPTENLSPHQIINRLKIFFRKHATMLFTRNHISDRHGNLKQRPVYAMDTLFIHLECMITYPLHMMARSMRSSIMYSMETLRGGCCYMNHIAQKYRSYLCIDWSAFDQRMPWTIVDTFFTVFLPQLLVINHGYVPTYEYPTYPGLTAHKLYQRLYNIICFLRLWYYNNVFVTADGYAYTRNYAGIASGMLNTQYLDSYCNLFLMLHALLHFGCTDTEIESLTIFVMGDDNVMLTNWTMQRLDEFMKFFEQHALTRFGMVLSSSKSILTILRHKIEMLGYTCNYGYPNRPIGKLIAQLCYPEHGPIDKYMSSRAVGMAWASAGMDPDFFCFCHDVYNLFEPFRVNPTDFEIDKILKHLPGVFKMLDNPEEYVNPDVFPTIDQVRSAYNNWQGELSYDHKWPKAHFIYSPETIPLDNQTMQEYMNENALIFPEVIRLF